MTAEQFDTIIVGARCAGAPLATHLARGGQRVLLLDADKLPSDQPLSTHFIHAVGVDWLDELGVGARVRRLAPPSPVSRIQLLDAAVDVRYQRGRAALCVRRDGLDEALQGAAVAAGVTLRDRTKVVGLLHDKDRVCGVETISDGQTHRIRASVVVGADGRNSTLAKLTGAREYCGYDNLRFAYWAYWPAPRAWREDSEFSRIDSFINLAADKVARFAFQTGGDALLLGVSPPVEHAPRWQGDFEAAYLDALRSLPTTAKLVDGNRFEGKLLGVKKARFFFRAAAGPGYALVGDAGLHKDPTPGFGITDALRDARSLARAILIGGDAALRDYHRQRDRDSVELFQFAKRMGDPAYINPLNHLVFERVRENSELIARMARMADREISPFAVVPGAQLLRWLAGSALRGRTAPLREFPATAIHQAQLERERRSLLSPAESR